MRKVRICPATTILNHVRLIWRTLYGGSSLRAPSFISFRLIFSQFTFFPSVGGYLLRRPIVCSMRPRSHSFQIHSSTGCGHLRRCNCALLRSMASLRPVADSVSEQHFVCVIVSLAGSLRRSQCHIFATCAPSPPPTQPPKPIRCHV